MKRRWVKIVFGLFFVSTLVYFVIEQFWGTTQLPLFNFCIIVSGLVLGILSILGFNVVQTIEIFLWRRGVFLDDDRHQSVSVDDSIMKTEFEITSEQMVNFAPRLNTINPWKIFYNFLLIGILLVIPGIWLITSYSGISVPGFIMSVLVIIWVVVGIVYMRFMKLFFLKMRCEVALLNCRCGSCRYELQGQIPEPDGCVVCPECGGAWRLDRCPKCATKLESGKKDLCPVCGWNRSAEHEAESEPAR